MANPDIRRHWWTVAIRGLFAVLFGFAAIFLPLATLAALVILYGAFALIDGIIALAFAFGRRTRLLPVWALVLEGLLGIGAGIIAFAWPGITLIALIYVVAFWAIARGLLELTLAVRLRKEISHEWFLAIAGMFSIALGVLMAIDPALGALALAWSIGFYAIAFGAMLIGFSFRLRSLERAGPPSAI